MRTAALALLLAATLSITSFAQVKKPLPPPVKAPYESSLQAVVVVTPDWPSVTGTAWMFERKTPKSDWKRVDASFPVVVGRSGLAWGDTERKPANADRIKKEGDGNSPAGLFPLIASFGTAVKPEAVESPYTKLDQFTECVDDVASNHYNKIVNRMQVGAFDWKSSEKMLEIGQRYELGIVVGYNMYPVVPGNGSCIFLHIWAGPGEATSGCTAMDRRNLERLFGWLSVEKTPYLVQMPESEYNNLRKAWKLPKIK
jgi:D-alanyl-D-alanine dipeptidase